MIRSPIGNTKRIALGVVSMLFLVLGYTWLAARQHRDNPNDTTIPTWSQLYQGVERWACVSPDQVEIWREAKVRNPLLERPRSWFERDAKATLTRLFLGMALGVAGGVIIGVLMGASRLVEAFLMPPITFLAKIPPTASLAVFFVLVGTNLAMFISMIVFGILPTVSQSVYIAIRDVPDKYFYKAYTLGASSWTIIWRVMVPFVLPKILDTIRLAFGPAIVYLVAAEMVCGDVGLGYRIRLQARLLNMDVVYPYLVILGTFTFAMDYGLKFLQRKMAPWYITDSEQ